MKLRMLLIFAIGILATAAKGDDSISEGWRHSLGLDVRPSYAFPSYLDDILSASLDDTGMRKTTLTGSLHLQYGFSFPSYSKQGRICRDAWQGLGTGVSFMGNPRGLGTPVSVYVFQGAPIWCFSENLSAYYEWNFGASMGWKPCDGVRARSNLIVGSRVNAYINLGLGLKWSLDESWSVMAGVELTHYSNGNTSFPNPGVNLARLRVGVVRKLGSGEPAAGSDGRESVKDEESGAGRRIGYDVTVYGALRKRVYRGGETPVLLNGRFGVAGLDFAPMWRITKNFRTGPSVDLQWDESTDLRRHHVDGTTAEDIRFRRPGFFNQVCVGLSGRAELEMPIFSVNVGMGYNVIGPEETRATYQLANLKVRITDAFFVNVGYQLLNFQKQNNLMLGFGFSL